MILQTTVNEICIYHNELENMAQNQTQGAITRSRARWAENGEKNTKYFLNLKKNYDKKVIHKLRQKFY